MENGFSVVNSIPPAFKPDFDLFLFNRPEHLALQGNGWIHQYLVNKNKQRILAQVSFCLESGRALTPRRAPFGSFQYSNKLSPQDLYEFIQQCEAHLRKLNVTSVRITEPPLFYRPSGEIITSMLINLGYRVSQSEISAGIQLDKGAFNHFLSPWEKRKLKQAKTAGAVFRNLSVNEFEKVYNFLLACRQERGHKLSMSLEDLQATVNRFRKEFFLSGVYVKDELTAAGIAIRVHKTVLYTFYYGHLKKFDSISPVVTLLKGIYGGCASRGIQLLDLGTSTIDGGPNFSLLDFKLRLGAAPSMKLTFEKDLQ